MSDEEDANVPDRDTCQQRIEQFVQLTQSNEAVAQQFLQEAAWDLERAVSAFYDALAAEQEINSQMDSSVEVVKVLFGNDMELTNEPPPRLQLLSWNLDGLDDVNLKRRMAAVVTLVKKHQPDVIFFQEVIDEVADYFDRKLIEYKAIRGNNEGYYTMTLFRVFTIFYDSHSIVDYPSSTMGRNLMICRAHVGKRQFVFLNSHLESTKDFAEERINQLKKAFFQAQNYSPDINVIFGGDLNLRDSEEFIPPGFHDIWKYCGARKELQYTWDMLRNSNKSGFGKFKPRMRFDRIYVRPERSGKVTPKNFGLVGAQRATNTQSFPSDHWGIVAYFDLKH